MAKRSKRHAAPADTKQVVATEPLTGRDPNNPPRRNLVFLICSLGLFAIWLGILVWLSLTS